MHESQIAAADYEQRRSAAHDQSELKHSLESIRHAAEMLADYAAKRGVVITVEQVPVMPPTMGRYITAVDVRPARQPAQPDAWCSTMKRKAKDCGCPDCGRSLVDCGEGA
jgi:hypothetical protein